jgi:2-keto-4-pentenoate hydratase/2-oxohepta-3-ene-1,7-dioic acid hydratase in catechol pathway
MKLVSFSINKHLGFGAVVDDQVVDLTNAFEGVASIRELIEKTDLSRITAARETAKKSAKTYALSDLELLPPVPQPEKIWCIGVNYGNRNAEYKDGSDLPKYPSLFVRSPSSFVGHQAPLERPRISEQLDYEGEIVLVVGKGGRHILRQNAFEHIFGLTICNEGTIRDWLHHGKFNVTQGKNFDRSGSIGPWIVTSDECDPAQELTVQTRVNGELRQNDTTANMMFPFDYLISYLSTFATLKPGDLIVTGTPIGAGVRMTPPVWLKPGDLVEVEVPGVGILRNGIADEA